MNYAIVLSGGTGIRLGSDIPKQYIEVGGKPILIYCLETLENTECIDEICIVASKNWQAKINEWVKKYNISKVKGIAEGGKTRQHSLLNGLSFLASCGAGADSAVLIHDAARPNVSSELIKRCIDGIKTADGVLPILPVKDTMYTSIDRKRISGLLNREQLFSGQAPESFRFEQYYEINRSLSDEELGAVRGSAEIAFKKGMIIELTDGDENNYKITTAIDLDKFKEQVERNMRS